MKRTATAHWSGTIKDGKGNLTTKSQTLNKQNYSYHSRFENGEGTNPEELIAAAHAGCFTMALSLNLTEAGYTPETLKTECAIHFQDKTIKESQLTTTANVPGIDADVFDKIINDAKENCPVSRALNAEVTLAYTLE